jgi:hypothetical protein
LHSNDIKKQLMRAAAASVAKQLRDRLSAIRHPQTGEFARVVVLGDTLDDMSIRVEGSPELLEVVRARSAS